MKVLILRHAESYGNATGNYSIAESDSLSARGAAQANAVVNALAQWEFTRIIVSPLKRAQDTIVPYLESSDKTAEIWPELAEACWQDCREPAGPQPEYVSATIPANAPNRFFFRGNNAVTPAKDETFGAGLSRVQFAAELLTELCEGEEGIVLMAVHGHVIREMLNILLAVTPYNEFHHDNCGMTLLSFDGSWKLEYCNNQPAGLP